jgi:hypothetical protein
MRKIALALALASAALLQVGCAANKGSHWEKQGASQNEFNMDSGQCRAQALSGTGGMVSVGTVMIMDSCMQGKGWYRVANP